MNKQEIFDTAVRDLYDFDNNCLASNLTCEIHSLYCEPIHLIERNNPQMLEEIKDDPDKLAFLNQITHAYDMSEIDERERLGDTFASRLIPLARENSINMKIFSKRP